MNNSKSNEQIQQQKSDEQSFQTHAGSLEKNEQTQTKCCWIVDIKEHGRRLIFTRVDLPSDASKLLQHINENLIGLSVRRSSPEDRDKLGEYHAVADSGLILEKHVNLTKFALTIESTRFM